jgi:hypothetical protein
MDKLFTPDKNKTDHTVTAKDTGLAIFYHCRISLSCSAAPPHSAAAHPAGPFQSLPD